MATNLEKMEKAVIEMERWFADDFFTESLAREITQLRKALASGDAVEIEEAMNETVDGCDTAVARLFGATYYVDMFARARDAYDEEIKDKIADFEAV